MGVIFGSKAPKNYSKEDLELRAALKGNGLVSGAGPRLNEDGVFESGFETITVPLAKTLNIEASIDVVKVGPEDWRAAIRVSPQNLSKMSFYQEALRISDLGQTTRAFAIELAMDRLRNHALSATDKAFGAKVYRALCDIAVPPGATSTTTPAGIRRFDPLAEFPDASPSLAAAGRKLAEKIDKRAVEIVGLSSAPGVPAGDVAGEVLAIAVDLIEWHPSNPRQDFAVAELQSLADTMQRVGTLQPIVVRLHPAPADGIVYQGLAGERRWRAARLRHLETIPATVRVVDDAAALDIVVTENFARKDLTAIEQARAIQSLTKPVAEGGAGLKQKEVAERYGHHQSWAANLLRLLELPAAVQKKVSAGELDQASARALVPYAHVPELIERIVEDLEDNPTDWAGGRHFFEAELSNSILQNTRRVNEAALAKLTDEQRQDLQVLHLPVPSWSGKTSKEMVVINTKLWDELHPRNSYSEDEPAKKPKKADGKPAKLTAAQQQAKEREAAQVFRERIELWRRRWLRWSIAQLRYGWALDDGAKNVGALELLDVQILLWAAAYHQSGEVTARLAPAMQAVTDMSLERGWDVNHWPKLRRLADGDDIRVAHAFLHYLFWPQWGKENRRVDELRKPHDMTAVMVEDVFEASGIALEDAWSSLYQSDAGRELLRQFLSLHTKDQLFAQAAEWSVEVEPSTAKTELVDDLLIGSEHPLPECYAPRKPAKKAKPKKKGAKR